MRLPTSEPSVILTWIAIILITAIFYAFLGAPIAGIFFVIMAIALGGVRKQKP